jgi:hypothetical protein
VAPAAMRLGKPTETWCGGRGETSKRGVALSFPLSLLPRKLPLLRSSLSFCLVSCLDPVLFLISADEPNSIPYSPPIVHAELVCTH